jgi:Asp-tRNAAsn/Glu-tRNAGln amidotransferase A subunit and related amidases
MWTTNRPLTLIAGLTRAPQLSEPLAQVDGRPVGLSLLAAPGRDAALVAVARALFGGAP